LLLLLLFVFLRETQERIPPGARGVAALGGLGEGWHAHAEDLPQDQGRIPWRTLGHLQQLTKPGFLTTKAQGHQGVFIHPRRRKT
jgi:hypothetical protein